MSPSEYAAATVRPAAAVSPRRKPAPMLEARILASRLGMRPAACDRWMRANGLSSILDLHQRYPGAGHAQSMALALAEIWSFEPVSRNGDR